MSVGGQFHCSSSLAWGAVWLLSSVASLCGGYGGWWQKGQMSHVVTAV